MSRQPFRCQDAFALATKKPVLNQGAEHRCEFGVDPSVDPMQGSIGVGGDHLTPLEGNEGAEGNNANRVPDKLNVAITKQTLMPPGWKEYSWSLAPALLPAVKRRPEPTPVATLPWRLLVGGSVLVIGLARNTEGGIGFGPPPVATSHRPMEPPAGPARAGPRPRIGRALTPVVVAFGVWAQITRVTTGILPNRDRIAQTVGAFSNPESCPVSTGHRRGMLEMVPSVICAMVVLPCFRRPSARDALLR